jgi:hypothetical protein
MHVTITGVPRPGSRGENAAEKVERLVIPFVQSLRDAYIAAKISDDESATKDILTDILVYASEVEKENIVALAHDSVRAAQGELFDADQDAAEEAQASK